jgi:hypothetical protein
MAVDVADVADITIVLGGTGTASGQIITIPDATSTNGPSTPSQTGPSTSSLTGRTIKENGAVLASFISRILVNTVPTSINKRLITSL